MMISPLEEDRQGISRHNSHHSLEFIDVDQKSSNVLSCNHATLWFRAL